MKLNKKQLINDLETEVKDQIREVSKHFVNASEDLLQKSADDGGWSILQCLDHLNSYGNYYLPEIAKAIKKAKFSKEDIYHSGWLGDYFEKIMSPDTGTKKFKAFKGHIPERSLNSTNVLNEFIRQENLLLDYLTSSKALNLESAKVPVSIAKFIRLRLGDTFRFIVAHNKRHIQQALRHL